jgi:hypothetical protein
MRVLIVFFTTLWQPIEFDLRIAGGQMLIGAVVGIFTMPLVAIIAQRAWQRYLIAIAGSVLICSLVSFIALSRTSLASTLSAELFFTAAAISATVGFCSELLRSTICRESLLGSERHAG